MKPYHLVWQVVAALAVMAVYNVAIKRASWNAVPRQLLRKAKLAEGNADLFLGNSTMAAGLDEAAFAAAKPGSVPLNLGLGSSTSLEHYLIDLSCTNKSAAIYYGFMDMQLTDVPELSCSALVGNRAMGYYAGLDTLLTLTPDHSPLLEAELRLTARVPMLVERFGIWARVERLRRLLKSMGMPPQRENQFGRVEDFALLEPADPVAFASACRGAPQAPLSNSVSALFDRVNERGEALYVVAMPMTSYHRRTYYGTPEWKEYEAHLKTIVREKGGTWVSAADWIGDDGFDDHFHLNREGARIFSSRLAQWSSRLPGRYEPSTNTK